MFFPESTALRPGRPARSRGRAAAGGRRRIWNDPQAIMIIIHCDIISGWPGNLATSDIGVLPDIGLGAPD